MLNELLTIVGVVSGIVGTLFAVFIAFRSRQVFTPKIFCGIGVPPSAIKKHILPFSRKKPLLNVVYGGNIKEYSPVWLTPIYFLSNLSRVQLNNIVVRLTYPSTFSIKTEEVIKISECFEKMSDSDRARSLDRRYLQKNGAYCTCSFNIPFLRPGEKIILTDFLDFTKRHPRLRAEVEATGNTGMLGLYQRMLETPGLINFCVVDMRIFCEQTKPIERKINLLWLKGRTAQELGEQIFGCMDAFFAGIPPLPGVYWKPPWGKSNKQENALVVLPKWIKFENLCIEQALQSTIGHAPLILPDWNYYNAPKRLSRTDELLLLFGLKRI